MTRTVCLTRTPARPWRNGGGTTQELLTWPAVVGDDWVLRVSVARIDRPGPFSPFPGVRRGFVVLQGVGVRLALPQGTRCVERGDEPLWFEGEAAPQCELVEGPTLDLNFMLRRGAGRGRFARATPGSSIDGRTAWRALFAWEPVLLAIDDLAEPVQAGELVWSDSVDTSAWRLHGDRAPRAWWLTLES